LLKSKEKNFLIASFPIAGFNLLDFVFLIVDPLFIAGRGEIAIASVEISNQILFCLNQIVIGIVSGNNIFFARLLKKTNSSNNDVNTIFQISLYITLVAVLIFSVSCFFFPYKVISIFTSDINVLSIGSNFLKIYSLTWLWYSVSLLFIGILRCYHKNKVVLYIASSAFIMKLLLNYLLSSNEDFTGLATATLYVRVAECLLYAYLVFKRYKIIQMKLIRFNQNKTNLLIYIRKTFPVIVNVVIWSVGFSIITIFFSQMGVSVYAAFSIYSLAKKLSGFWGQAMITACSIFMGNIIAMGSPKVIEDFITKIFKTTVIISVFTGLLTIVIGKILLLFYNIDNITLMYAKQFIFIGGIIEFFRIMTSMNSMGILRAGADTKFVMINDFVFMWLIEIPVGFILMSYFEIPVIILFAFLNSEHLLKYITTFYRIKSNRWIKPLGVV
jgi:putative MATE family efflux protein